ncbi:MAG: rod shape-determining protein MreD [Firmicutes bacterium]|nr:rod shape-determining protein MreD [Bacillota bacterium]
MKITAMVLFFLLAMLLQTTVFSALPILGSYPDLVTVLVVNLGILNGRLEGAWLGFVAGLLRDLLVGRFVGLNAVVLALVGFTAGAATRPLYRDNYVVPCFFTVLGTWLGRSLVLVGMVLFGKAVPWNLQIVRFIGISGLYSAMITLIIYRWLARLNEHIIYWDEVVRRTR